MTRTVLIGVALVLIYTSVITGADAITKLVADGFAAPQLYALSGLIVVALSVVADRLPSQRAGLRTSCPRAMALRSGATVVAAVAFFNAFRDLPFAEVFLFIGLMPILAGVFSAIVLKEDIRPAAWLALAAGFVGVACLFPSGMASVSTGHLWALAAAVFGTFSIVLSRLIGRYETNALAQVFYPNLALGLTMLCALPFVWKPMAAGDLALVAAYATLLFAARWLLVVALRLIAAYVAMPLMNLQFIWMVLIGAIFFGEQLSLSAYLGAAVVIASGIFLVWDQFAPARAKAEPLANET
jgi:drug/metabolite transporter (DMT)-like permease